MTTTGTRADPAPARTTSPGPAAARGWAVYARLSARKYGGAKKRRNELETVERQITETRAWAARMGIIISEDHIYIDNHLSAWKKNGNRPAFQNMIHAAKRGEFPGILVWKIDRFTRRTKDAIAFCDLAEEHHVLIDGPTSGRYDLQSPDDRKAFRDAASEAEHSSDITSQRVTSWFREARPQGLQIAPGRVFGFEVLSKAREYDDDKMPIQRPEEAEIVREIARRKVHANPKTGRAETWRELADDLNKRGILTTRGNKWLPSVLAVTIRHPRNVGYQTENKQPTALMPATYPDGTPYVPMLDTETYLALIAPLVASRETRGRLPDGSYPLSGVAVCGNCGRTLAGGGRGRRTDTTPKSEGYRRYVCPESAGGCGISVRAVDLEQMTRDEVVRVSADPGLRAQVAVRDRELDLARETLRQDLARTEAELVTLDEQMAGLEVRHLKRDVREVAYRAMKDTLDELIGKAEARRVTLRVKLADVGAGTGDLPVITAEEWDAATAGEKREWLRRLGIVPTLHPVLPRLPGARINVFDPRRVTFAEHVIGSM